MMYARNVTILLIPTHPWPFFCAWKEVEELNPDIASTQITSIHTNKKPKESKITKRCCFCLILIQKEIVKMSEIRISFPPVSFCV